MHRVYLAWTHAIHRITESKALRRSALFFVMLVSVAVYISIYAGNAGAAANNTINFQARVLKNTGALVPDGFYTIQFNVYSLASGGSTQWTETQVVTSKNGYITASLGSVTPFGPGIDWSQEQWLSMNINGDGEMAPRMKITAVPLAFRAVQADTLTTSSGTIAADQLTQLTPGLVQSVNSTNSALRINQNGSGGLLQLQGNGVDVFTLNKSGGLAIAQGLTVGNSGLTTAGTIRWSGTDFEGYDGSDWRSFTSGGSGGGSSGTPNLKTVVKTTNETVNNSATLQNDDELKFSIGADETWTYRFVLQANSGTTPDFRFAVTAPSGATCRVAYIDPEGATSNGQYGCGVSTTTVSGNGGVDVYEITGAVTNGANAGDVTLQWAQFTANASNTIVYAGSYVVATATTDVVSLDFTQNGNSFSQTAVLGTTDNFGLNVITNGLTRLSVSNAGAVSVAKGLTVGEGLTVGSGLTVTTGGVNITGISVLSGSLQVSSGGASIDGGVSLTGGGLDVNSNGITNAGDILGVGNSISASGGLTISTGAGNSLQLDSGNDILILNDATVRRTASGTTAIELNDTADTLLSITNSDGTAVAGLSVEGAISAQGFSGDGSALTNLNASSITSGTLSDTLLSSNVALLNTAQSFSGIQTFGNGLVVGNTATAAAGTIRWTGTDFEGYDGSSWVSLTGGGGGGPAPLTVAAIQAYDNTGGTDLNSATPTAVPWDAETKKDTGFTHSNSTNNTRVYLDEPGWYKINYNISGLNQSGNRNTVFCQVRFNGTTYNSPSGSYSYARNNTDAGGTNSSSVYAQTTAANEYYEVLCSQSGSSGPQYAVAGSSWTIAEKTAAPAGSPGSGFLQGGNSFGAAAILGTSDVNDLEIVTGGLTRITVSASGDTTIAGLATISGNLVANANTLLNGDVTIGDAATDVLTINSDTLQLPNGLDIANGTLVFDAAGNKIGINASASNTLSVNTAATADSAAEVLIYTNGINQKGLVLQSVSGQLANVFEVQTDGGVPVVAASSDGLLSLGSDISGSSNQGRLLLHDGINANGFTSVLGVTSLTASRNIDLPDASGTICISGSDACGFIFIAPGSAQQDNSTNNSLYINKTGASGDILNLQKNGTSVLRMVNSGALQLSLTSSTAFTVKNGSGVDYFNIDTNGGLIRIGGATADANGVLLVLDTKNTSGDPTGTDGGMYYNSASGKFRCYEGGEWIDCIGTRQVRSFIDTTSDSAVDSNTTSYWDTSGENNNSVPNFSPSTTAKSITGSISMEVSSATTADRSIVARVERSIGSPAACGSGTPVGTILSTFTTNNGEQASNTMIFLDSPNTTSAVYYTLCSDTATSNASSMTINRIRITLEEANNSN